MTTRLRLALLALAASLLLACTDEDTPPTVATAEAITTPATTAPPKAPAQATPQATPCTASPSTCALAARPTSTPLAVPPPTLIDGLPDGAVGPLLVYRRLLRYVAHRTESSIVPIYEVVVYDVGAGKPVATFLLGDEGGSPYWVRVVGREVLVTDAADGRFAMQRLALDGSVVATVPLPAGYPRGISGGFEVTRDGRWASQAIPGGVAIVDLRDGSIAVQAAPEPVPPEPLEMRAWEQDGRWAVYQELNPHVASGLWLLDRAGTLRRLAPGGDEARWSIASDGRYALRRTELPCIVTISQGLPPCAFVQTGFVVRDLDTNTDIATVTYEDFAQSGVSWSLDGDRLLYWLARPARTDSQNALEWLTAPRTWHVLDLRTGVSTPTAAAALERGEVLPWRVVLHCSLRPDLFDMPYIEPLAPGVRGGAGGNCSALDVDGRQVGTGLELEVLGWIEVPR